MLDPTLDALLIFIKNPVAGRVKTRLAQTMGPDQALKVYLALSARTRKTALSLPVTRFLFYSDHLATDDGWEETDFNKQVQVGEDLGARMDHAFQFALQTHRRVVIIGSDCPELSPELLETAFHQLDHQPCVLGPAEDGGYYLLGLREPATYLFENMIWSTGSVAAETLNRMRERGNACYLLPTLSDVDYEDDWRRLGWEL